MERKTQSNGLINLLALMLAGGAGFALSKYSGTLTGTIASAFLGIGALVALVSWFQIRLEDREYLEKMEFQELTKSAVSSALFNAQETEVFPAQRSREQFERFFVPAFAVVLFFLQAGGAIYAWQTLAKVIPTKIQDPTVPMALFGVFALVLFVLGKYSTGVARLQKLRLLRPSASYLLLGAYLCFAVSAAIAAVLLEFGSSDLYVAKVLTAIMFLIGLETLINLILEIYRPRVKGKVERPVYESRLVSLLGQPEGLIITARETLDYQFGFKVSETWGFRLVEKYIWWFIIGQAAVLLISTSFVFIDAGQEALLERNGKPLDVLLPGAHFKMPWPMDKVYRYATEQIQTVNVGFVQEESPLTGNVVLWTVAHSKEENFLVANRQLPNVEEGSTNASISGNRPPPVSLLTVSIPVQFQITNLQEWAYNNEDPVSLLEHLASREVVHYLVSVDFQDIMSKGRWDAGQVLRDRIQAKANERKMGASVVFVGLQDIHPPQKVAADYEKVVSAISVKEAAILAANADAIRSTNLADAAYFKTVSAAQSDSIRRKVDASAQAALFTNQIPAYLASPSVYATRAYLQTVSRSMTNARTYLVLTSNTQDVVILNLEDKIRRDILSDLTVPAPKAK